MSSLEKGKGNKGKKDKKEREKDALYKKHIDENGRKVFRLIDVKINENMFTIPFNNHWTAMEEQFELPGENRPLVDFTDIDFVDERDVLMYFFCGRDFKPNLGTLVISDYLGDDVYLLKHQIKVELGEIKIPDTHEYLKDYLERLKDRQFKTKHGSYFVVKEDIIEFGKYSNYLRGYKLKSGKKIDLMKDSKKETMKLYLKGFDGLLVKRYKHEEFQNREEEDLFNDYVDDDNFDPDKVEPECTYLCNPINAMKLFKTLNPGGRGVYASKFVIEEKDNKLVFSYITTRTMLQDYRYFVWN